MRKIGTGKQNFTRRHALRLAAVGIMGSTAAAVVTQQMTAAGSQAAGDTTLPEAALSDIQLSTTTLFDEIYKGRHITGVLGRAHRRLAAANSAATNGSGATGSGANGAADASFAQLPQILVDGVELHVMTNANGTYTSVINHYQSFRSLHEVARAAVDSLGDAALVHVHPHG